MVCVRSHVFGCVPMEMGVGVYIWACVCVNLLQAPVSVYENM